MIISELIFGTLKGLISPITGMIGDWQKRKAVKLEGELAISKAVTVAKIERISTQQMADIKWENTALVNAGIKDEVMMAVILTPMIACFVPWLQPFMKEGFQIMNDTLPAYWEYAFYSTVGVSYGLKKWTDFKSIMKGN